MAVFRQLSGTNKFCTGNSNRDLKLRDLPLSRGSTRIFEKYIACATKERLMMTICKEKRSCHKKSCFCTISLGDRLEMPIAQALLC